MPQKLFLRKVSDIEREPDVGLRECETEKFLNELWEERMPESIWRQGIGFARTVPEAGNGKERETGAVTGGGNGVSIAAVPENTERRTEREGETERDDRGIVSEKRLSDYGEYPEIRLSE